MQKPAGYVLYHQYKGNRKPNLGNYKVITQLDTCLGSINIWPQLDYQFLDYMKDNGWKIVLHKRDPYKTIQSMKNQNKFMNRSGLSKWSDQQIVDWIENHYQLAEEKYQDDPDFVSFQIEDGKEALESFLNVEFPWWGVKNARR